MTKSDHVSSNQYLFRQLVLDSDPNAIHLVESFIEDIRSELAFKDDVYGNVMVAVTEAVNNSIVHGNRNDPTKKVYVDCGMENPYRLHIWVKDEGEGFNPADLPDPTAPENIGKIGGRGVFLMKSLADELLFLEEGKSVEMIFNI